MFTGIVEEIGKVKEITSNQGKTKLQIEAQKVLESTQIGDSICVNGVCLTVERMTPSSFTADVMPETLNRSNLGKLKSGDSVDLERAMRSDGRFGGHIVSGHIDGTGIIKQKREDGNATWITIETTPEILRYIVEKGSIAIDGISLTVADVTDKDFSVSLIPHTGKQTILLQKNIGSQVNLENDIIGKYVEKLINPIPNTSSNKSKLTLDFLKENGF